VDALAPVGRFSLQYLGFEAYQGCYFLLQAEGYPAKTELSSVVVETEL